MKFMFLSVLLSVSFLLRAEPWIDFSAAGLQVVGSEKTRHLISSAVEPVPGTGRRAVGLSWKQGCFYYAEMHLRRKTPPPLEKFDRAEFILRAETVTPLQVADFGLRFADAGGEIFQVKSSANPLASERPGPQSVKIVFDPSGPLESWGKKADRKIDWPLRFLGLTCTFMPRTGGGRLLLDSLDLRLPDEALKAVSVELDTGHPLRLLVPGSAAVPKLVFINRGRRNLQFSAAVKFSDFDGNGFSRNYELELPPAARKAFEVSGPWPSLGIWYADYTLRQSRSEAVISGRRSLVRMSPAGPRREPPSGFMFGVCSHPERGPEAQQKLEALAAGLCGARYLRTDSLWQYIQPAPGVWRFDKFDRIVDLFSREGVEVMPLLTYTPGWAVAKDWKPYYSGRKRPTAARPDYDAYAEFAARMAARYRGKIRFFEIWNEPDIGFADFSVDEYLELQRRGYAAIKKANPEAVVFTAGFTALVDGEAKNFKPRMIARTLAEGRGDFDILAFHGHGSFSHYAPQIARLNELRRKAGNPSWHANETAISAINGAEAYQAETLFKKLLFSWSEGAVGYNWYDLRNDGYDPYNAEHNFGMLTRDFYPKAVYPVYNLLAGMFEHARYQRRIELNQGIFAWLFQRRGDLLIPHWSEPGAAAVLAVGRTDARTVERIDLMGNARPVPIADGYFLLTSNPRPATFRLNRAGTFQLGGRLIDFRDPGVVVPGRETTLRLILFNPFADEQEFVLSAENLTEQVRLRSRETRNLQLKIPPTRSPMQELHCELKNRSLSGKIDIPLSLAQRLRATPHATPDFVLNRASQRVELYPNNPLMLHMTWKGPEDLAAAVRLSASASALILEAQVTDDRHCQPYRGGEVWQGDNLQVAFVFPGQSGSWELGFTRLSTGRPEVHIWQQPKGQPGRKDEIALRTSRQGTVTTYRAEMPFRTLGIGAAALQRGFRFNLLVNDNDGDGRKGWLQIAPGLGEKKDASFFPMMVME